MTIGREDGAALFVTLIMVMILSLLGASLMFTAQSETWSAMNYRLMMQARYGAEAGIHHSANFLTNSYTVPSGVDLGAYTMTSSPVTAAGQPVLLTSEPRDLSASNYPVGAVKTSFQNNVKGTFTSGNSVINYTATATLVGMRQVTEYGKGTAEGVQTWLITGYGAIDGVRNAQIQVETLFERQVMETFSYAAFATAAECAALKLKGTVATDSYDSSTYGGSGNPPTQNSDGNVGTNGNMTESGSATVNGTLSTPRSGVGNCTTGNMTALDRAGNASVSGGLLNLPQVVEFPAPDLPNPLPPNSSYTPPATWTPGTYGNISLTGNAVIHLAPAAGNSCPCVYNINSISMTSNSQLIIDSGPVIFNVVGKDGTSDIATPVKLTGGGVLNATMKPENFQVLYAGSGSVEMAGHAGQAALVYAPNASMSLVGTADFYGAIISRTFDDTGGAKIHYDRHLSKVPMLTIGNPTMSAFSWRKF